MSPHSRGVALTQVNALCAALAFVSGRLVLAHTSPWRFVALNYLIAVAANSLWWWLTHTGVLPELHAPVTSPARHLSRTAWLWLLIHTICSTAGFTLMWASFSLIPAHVGAILNRIEAVVGVLLGLWLLRENFSTRQWIGVVLAAGGVTLISLTTLAGQPLGFAYALGGALGFGLAEVSGKVAVRYVPVPSLVLIRAWIMAPLLCLIWWRLDPGLPQLTPALWAWLAASAMLGPVISRNAYMLALSYLPVSQVVMLNQTNPFYAALGAYLLLGEVPGWHALLGGTLIVGGVLTILNRRGAVDAAEGESAEAAQPVAIPLE